MNARQKQLLLKMAENGLDAALLTSGVSIRYYTGFTSDECAVLLTQGGCWLITDFRYTIQANAQAAGNATVIEANQAANQKQALLDCLKRERVETCGYEQEALSVARYEEYADFPVRWKAFGNEIALPRLIKSAEEVASLQKAQAIADEAFTRLLPKLHIGMTELEAKAELNYICDRLGSEGPSFDPIVGSGENGAMCHAIPGGRRIADGDFVVFDFGCVFEGYHSDMTRTVGFGNVSDELRRIYDVTLEAQLKALSAVRAGVSGKAVDAVARDYIASKGYGECFGHGLGHGFGLEIHEPPRAAVTSESVLAPGMTLTIEPGIYLPGKGGVRIEDCVVVTEDGCLNLVSTAKDLLIL